MLKKESFKVFQGVLDDATLKTLMKLSSKGIIERMQGFVKRGKEGSVLAGRDYDGNTIAVKIYAIEASNFNRMLPYIDGDPRFSRIRGNKKSLILGWCKKEYKNMIKAHSNGILCPEPIASMRNILVMEFLGRGYTPAPRLIDADIKNPQETFEKVVDQMRHLYGCGIVHGDLSAYNILYWKREPYFIDFSHGVLKSHPRADDFLKRDVGNIVKFFKTNNKEETLRRVLE